MSIYLQDLNARVADGVARLPPAQRERHAHFLTVQQNPDGGFSGREGESDLYYTGFGLRGLSVLDALTPELAERAVGFLRGCLTRQTSVVDFFSFLYSCALVQAASGLDVLADSPPDWPRRVADTLASFRTSDHGYNKSPGATSGSTYHTFLVGLCFELLGQTLPNPDDVLRFVQARRRDDGGYVEVAAMRRSGTNPTAAAIGLLHLLKGRNLPAAEVETTIDYLAEMPSMEGGLRANDKIPLADLLSTFTGGWTLAQLGALDRINTRQAFQYVQSLERPEGGFLGGVWDEATDVEYTFYGLGSLALLHAR
ncbi:MAG: geranyl transferase [Planctomycetes bacterium]|jgi:geranylgeranyl transferase type-2 subunit beta|nr:geranyl transferase [Planctomycetota bacterium]